jgi:hypothetical protein
VDCDMVLFLGYDVLCCSCFSSDGCIWTSLDVEFILHSLLAVSSSHFIFRILFIWYA